MLGGPDAVTGSDRFGELVERGRDSQVVGSGVDAEFVVAATQVLDEGVTADHHRRGPVAFESTHRTQPRFETAMVGLDPVVLGYESAGAPGRVCRSGSRFRVVGFGVFGGIS